MNRDKQKDREMYLKVFKPMADDLRQAESWCDLDGVLNRTKTMENLYKMGYRKSSDVAREIFEEIEEILDRHSISYLKVGQICGEHYYDGVMQFDIAELKKKYTEGER